LETTTRQKRKETTKPQTKNTKHQLTSCTPNQRALTRKEKKQGIEKKKYKERKQNKTKE
jgi:hypothetical protein